MKRVLVSIFFGFIILVAILGLTRNIWVKWAAAGVVKSITGTPLEIKRLNIGVLEPVIHIEGMRLLNPPGYPEPLMADIPEIYVSYDLASLLGGKIYLKEARFDLAEFRVVKRADGQLNIDALKSVSQAKEENAGEKPEGGASQAMPEMRVDLLKLKAGKVVYKDYAQSPVKEEVFDLGINEQFENITEPADLVNLIVWRVVARTAVGRLAGFETEFLQDTLKDTLGTAAAVEKTLKDATDTIKNGVQQLFGQ